MPGNTDFLVKVLPTKEAEWGLLVKSWADGSAKPPSTVAELRAAPYDKLISIPAFITGLVVMQHSREVLVINLPCKELIDAAAQQMQSGQYQLPGYYLPFFPHGTFNVPSGQRANFQAARIGEYSIAQCL